MENETLHIFDAYTRGKMNDSERQSFEQQLASNEEIRKEFEEYIHIVNGIQEYERERIKATITDPKARLMDTRRGWTAFKRVAVAAAVILIIVIPGYIIFKATTHNEQLAREYTVADPGIPVKFGASSYTIFDQAMIEYKEQQFDKSLEKLKALKMEKPGNDTVSYFAGLCEFETGNMIGAVQNLQMVTDRSSHYFIPARYTLGLCYLKLKQEEKAIEAFTLVAEHGDGELKRKAAELLKKLQ
jgi:tetratricopeptide (TPR) repeat protein